MNYYLSLAALVPAVILFVRIYQLDRIEKEPRRLLGILLLSGALLALPAAGIQLLASRTLGSALNRRSAVFLLLDNFLVVAVSEEVCKIVPVRLAAWKHPAFDYRFDAVVYSVSSALGFAAVENILYVVQSDLRTAVSRAVLSVPGHFFFAVAMGLLLSRGKQAEKQGNGRGGRFCARWRS
ncbi:MAG: PrsW family intramembrane metalloprotease [Acutalibacteraceae bacterium]